MHRRYLKVVGFPFYLTLFIISYFTYTSAQQKSELSLAECYDLAVKQSESLQRKEEDVKAAEARYKEAVSLLYPNLHALGSQRIRNSENFGRSFSGDVNNPSTSSRGNSRHPLEATLSVRQPIFSGLRDIYSARASKYQISALTQEKDRQRELLYLDVAEVFNQIIYYQEDIKLLIKTEDVLKQRVNELREFINLGKARDSEIEAAQSEIASVGAAQARVNGLLGASREMLAFLIGVESSKIELKPSNSPIIPAPIDDLISRSRERADIKAVLERVTSSEYEVKSAEGERWPSLALEGNYYAYEDPDQNREWDLLFLLDIPIFEGGGIDARIEQSRSRYRSTLIEAKEAHRIAEKEVRIAYNDLIASQAEVSKLKTLLAAARKNYESQRRDYQLGVVNNLEVLSAIRNFQNAARQLLEAEIITQINNAKLQVATGGFS